MSPARRRWPLLILVGLATAACSGGASSSPTTRGPNLIAPGAPGETGRRLTPEEAAALAEETDAVARAYGEVDVAFVQGMIVHHSQAIELVALVEGRAEHPDLAVLSERIEVGQLDEIEQMQRWLTERGEPVEGAHHEHHAMPGLLTDEELAELAATAGAEFDQAYLAAMIYHHQGAVRMVEELIAAGGGTETELFTLATHLASEQQVEISRMSHLLAELRGD